MSKKTFKAIKDSENEAIIQVKKNQKKLLERCEKISKKQEALDYNRTITDGRNRVEDRKAYTYKNIDYNKDCDDDDWNKYIKTIIKVSRTVNRFDTKTKTYKESKEIAFYVSTLEQSAKEANERIRGHWGVENRNHYVRDVSLEEDKSRIRRNPNIFAKLRSFGLNILRFNNIENISVERYDNSLKFTRVLDYKGLI